MTAKKSVVFKGIGQRSNVFVKGDTKLVCLIREDALDAMKKADHHVSLYSSKHAKVGTL